MNRKVGKKEAFFWILTGFWAGVIWGLSSIASGDMPSPGFDFPFAPVSHFVLYFALAGFSFGGLSETKKNMSRMEKMLIIFSACLAYGIIDEIHQSFVPGRSPELRDVVIDAAGAFAFLAVSSLRMRFR